MQRISPALPPLIALPPLDISLSVVSNRAPIAPPAPTPRLGGTQYRSVGGALCTPVSPFITLSDLTVRASNEAIGGDEAIGDEEGSGDGVLGRLHAELGNVAEVEFPTGGGDESLGSGRGRGFDSNDNEVRGGLGGFRTVLACSIDV